MIPALLKWIGNKQRFADTIISYMPETFNNYYEPFLGSGAVMAAILDADLNKLFPHFNHAYGSDILPFLIDIFNLTKDNPKALIDYYQCEITKYNEDPATQYNITKNVLMHNIIHTIFYSFQGLAIPELSVLENPMDI